MLPPLAERRRLRATTYFGAPSRGFDDRCLRFTPPVAREACKTRFRLLAGLYRAGFGLPARVNEERFRILSIHPPFPGLAWRDPRKLRGRRPPRSISAASVLAFFSQWATRRGPHRLLDTASERGL